jgi:hypothetical protein
LLSDIIDESANTNNGSAETNRKIEYNREFIVPHFH